MTETRDQSGRVPYIAILTLHLFSASFFVIHGDFRPGTFYVKDESGQCSYSDSKPRTFNGRLFFVFEQLATGTAVDKIAGSN